MTNFRDIARGLEQAGAALKAADEAGLAELLARLLGDADARASMGRCAATWHQGNRGATERTLALLRGR
jgi:3-deoxy-D-manno-octulosonic-acid transferase